MSENATAAATPMRERTAEEIRVVLARRRLSASELARRMGVTQPYISRRLTGEIAFDVDDLERIAMVLQVTPASLLPSGGGLTTAYYLEAPQSAPHAVDVRSPRGGLSGSNRSRSRRSRRLLDHMAA